MSPRFFAAAIGIAFALAATFAVITTVKHTSATPGSASIVRVG